MNSRIFAAVLTVLITTLAVTLRSSSTPLPESAAPKRSEWPMFGGSPGRNLVQPFAKNLPVEWNTEAGKEKNIKWSAQLGSKAYSFPVVAGGRVFIGTNNQLPRDPADYEQDSIGRKFPTDLGVLMCFRESDGKFLWQATHKKLPTGRINDWPRVGVVSSPAVEGDRLYYVSNRCELICASVETGKAIWTLDMIGELGVFPHNMSSCSPLIVEDLVFAVTSNGVDEGHFETPAPKAPSFVAVNKRTGKLVWKDNAPSAQFPPINPAQNAAQREAMILKLMGKGGVIIHGQWSNPTYDARTGQVIFPGGDGFVRGYDPPTGKLLWKFNVNPQGAVAGLAGRGDLNDIIGTPVAVDGRLFVSVGQDPEHLMGVGRIWCIDLAKASAKGRFDPQGDVSAKNNNFDPKAAVNANAAFVWHYGGKTNAADRARLARNYYFGRSLSTCAVADGLVYAADLDGTLHCLDAVTGEPVWEHDTGAYCWASPLCADGKVYLGNDYGTVCVFAQGRKKELLAENEMDLMVRTAATAVGNVLYLTTENELYAIAIR